MYSVLFRPRSAIYRHVGNHAGIFDNLKDACRYVIKMNKQDSKYFYWVA